MKFWADSETSKLTNECQASTAAGATAEKAVQERRWPRCRAAVSGLDVRERVDPRVVSAWAVRESGARTVAADFADVRGLRNYNDNSNGNNVPFQTDKEPLPAAPRAHSVARKRRPAASRWRLCKQWLSTPLSWAGFTLPPCPHNHDRTFPRGPSGDSAAKSPGIVQKCPHVEAEGGVGAGVLPVQYVGVTTKPPGCSSKSSLSHFTQPHRSSLRRHSPFCFLQQPIRSISEPLMLAKPFERLQASSNTSF